MAVSNVRMPDEVYDRLREWARTENRSMNDLTVEIIDKETRRWIARRALAQARQAREEIRATSGKFPDSAPMIRQIREERSDRG